MSKKKDHHGEPAAIDNSSEERAVGGFNEKHSDSSLPVESAAKDTGYHDHGHYQDDADHNLHRGLKSRQITMIAIGGAIGTGLIIGT